MYPQYMEESLRKVVQTRPKRLELARKPGPVYPPMSEQERRAVLEECHPDFKPDAMRAVRVGPNKGEKLITEVAELFESHSWLSREKVNLSKPDIETDLLIIGGGGAGCNAALVAMKEHGVKSVIATKLRMGDANTMMSQGGMQAAVSRTDSPTRHYLDAIGGGHFENKPELVRALTEDGPGVVKWLEDLGVCWDKEPDGSLKTMHGGGTSRKRMLSCRDYTGAIIMRTLMDEVRNHPDMITVKEFMPAVELILDDKGRCAGAVLYNMDTEEFFVVKAKATLVATGGFGRLHIRGFDTTNHYGATGDGLVMAYRAGAKMMYMDSVQYHPTGVSFPEQIAGFLVTEAIRGAGGQPLNKDGELFVFPREPRDIEASAIIRECNRGGGIETPSGRVGVWLDSPLIDMIHGEGYTDRHFPAMYRQFIRYGIDITKLPMLIYPSLHYQNGGIEINEKCETTLPGLYVAGEASGGLHGRNRLMGNSVLDYNVFGRRAGRYAGEYVKSVKLGKLSVAHLDAYEKELADAGIKTDLVTPILLPSYAPADVKQRQWVRNGDAQPGSVYMKNRLNEKRTGA
ncbi:MAG: FAD-binding protein [Candidatus Nitricoxidivorans perseverans]|uniref:FAD-binding protein n=1 Tax=Candidatus Nitricoxidivorans perseverans TaxID=2975601 RepID=A0AA49IYY8_9PROT|nr:MAG: FAD-binding protein [Candidatus Nitricoxidivorans perseverans]